MKISRYLILLLLPLMLFAEIGKISVSKGDVTITRGNEIITAQNGSKIEEKDIIISKNSSSAQLLFKDGTVITIGANTNFKISEYLYEESNNKSNSSMTVNQGVFRAITGKIGKLNPNNFKLQTKSSSIGIRGTNFRGTIPAVQGVPEKIACTHGAITVAPINSNIVPVVVPAGFMTTVMPGKVEAPKLYTKADLNEIDKPIEQPKQEDKAVTKEETKQEEAKKEEPKKEETKQEQSKEKQEKGTKEETKKEESKQEQPKKEEKAVVKEEVKKEETQQQTQTNKQTENTQATEPKQQVTQQPTQEKTSSQPTTNPIVQQKEPIAEIQQPATLPLAPTNTQSTPTVTTPVVTSTPVAPFVPTPVVTTPTINVPTNVISEITKITAAATQTAQVVQEAQEARDTTAPIVTLTNIVTATNINLYSFSGTSSEQATITIKNGDIILGTVTTTSNQIWSFTPSVALNDGIYNITLVAIDSASNKGYYTAPTTMKIDTTPPTVTSVTLPTLTNDATPTITGTSEVGALITIKNGNEVLGTTTTNSDGIWSFTPSVSLTDGSYALSISATDTILNTSVPITTTSFSVDTTLPTITANTLLVSNDKAIQVITENDLNSPTPPTIPDSSSTIIEITSDNLPTFSGKSEVGALITIKNGATTLGTTTTDSNGNWEFTPTTVLSDGGHTINISSIDLVGNESASTIEKNIIIDTTAPVISFSSESTVTPPSIPTNSTQNEISVISNSATPTISGVSEAGATITVYNGTTQIGTTTVGSDGSWSFTPSTTLGDGSYNLHFKVSDSFGNLNENIATASVLIDTIVPAKLDVSLTQDTGILNIDNITSNGTLSILHHESNSVLEYSRDGGITWSSTYQVVQGENTIYVRQRDSAGNISEISHISYIYDNVAPIISINSSQITLNAISGISNDLSQVKVIFNGTEYTSEVTNGVWQVIPNMTQSLTNGEHTLALYTQDLAGNSATQSLTVATTALNAVFGQDDTYNNWGYWTSNITTGGVDTLPTTIKGWWTSGTPTPQSTIDALIATNTVYSYAGHIAGDVIVNSGTLQAISLDSTNQLNFDVRFGASNPINVKNINFTTTDGTQVAQTFTTSASGNITTNAFSANATNSTSNLNLLNGKFYGPDANSAAGQWNGNFGNVSGSGIFKASK